MLNDYIPRKMQKMGINKLSIDGPQIYSDQSTIRPQSGCKAIVRNIKLSMIKLYMYIIVYFNSWFLLEDIGVSRGSEKAN